MENLYSLIVINEELDSIKKVEISEDNIPEELNGESGFHIFYVRMLTELILRELKEKGYNLSEKQINDISIASSLHDIGKVKIPKSILDFPGKLSPVEYDIIKKHTVLGEELIKNANSDVDTEILKHAFEIARNHHERCDGTGYPDGKKGEEIPISAQVVSLADAYDALTSLRSYKEAFSQDVAIEMIANGMCGFFDEKLVECLLNVVNDKVLVKIRENLKEKRRIVADPDTLMVKNTLIIGNTGYLTKKFIDETFENSDVLIVGETDIAVSKNIRVFKGNNPPLEEIFSAYEFDMIIFLSNELTFNAKKQSDANNLREILDLIAKYNKSAKVMYFTSLDGGFTPDTDKGILTVATENLCEYYTKHFNVDIKIVRIPYLYSGKLSDDFLYKVFEQMEKGKVVLPFVASERTFFLSLSDLSSLIIRFTDNWQEGVGTLTVNEEFHISFLEFAEQIKKIKPDVSFDFTGEYFLGDITTNNRALRNEYGWFSKISVLDDIFEEYENYLVVKERKTEGRFNKFKKWLTEHSLIVKIAELILLFLITEILNYTTNSSLFFSIVDFRMAFTVIIATVHGLYFGLLAAGLSSLSYLVAKIISGTKWLTIFYEPSNWLPFIYFFLVGALCGYVKLKKDDRIKFLLEENNLLEEKLEFTRDLYNDIFEEKRDLKKQIISSKDSFGKIFDVTRNLDTVEPRELFLKIMDTFEEILENKSICVYSVGNNSYFGRLEVASRDIIEEASRSISLDSFSPIIERIKKDEIWKNTNLIPGLPMYAAGIYKQDKLQLLIFLWYVKPDQRTLYYVNLFKILCDLAEMSLLRALDYTNAVYENQYIEGTSILNKEEFYKAYDNFKKMADRKVFVYSYLEIEMGSFSYKEINDIIIKKIRANDILGDLGNGKIGLLLSQAGEEDLKYVMPRFSDIDVKIEVIKD